MQTYYAIHKYLLLWLINLSVDWHVMRKERRRKKQTANRSHLNCCTFIYGLFSLLREINKTSPIAPKLGQWIACCRLDLFKSFRECVVDVVPTKLSVTNWQFNSMRWDFNWLTHTNIDHFLSNRREQCEFFSQLATNIALVKKAWCVAQVRLCHLLVLMLVLIVWWMIFSLAVDREML